MREKWWLTSSFPMAMLRLLGKKAGERKLRLFACACCRTIWPLLLDERSRRAIEVAESYAEGCASSEELADARRSAWDVAVYRGTWDSWFQEDTTSLVELLGGIIALGKGVPALGWRTFFGSSDKSALDDAADAAAHCTAEKAWNAADDVRSSATLTPKGFQGSSGLDKRYAEILRCLFGNPFRPRSIATDWLTWQNGLVVSLARSAYEQRSIPAGTLDNTRLAVLADALEEAGCADEPILLHLRSGGEHYRGCFVLDALLGKS